jgi:RND family efflux transporter MFP subunit
VSQKRVTPGNLITGGTASGTLLTTIESIDPIYCYVDADERSVLKYQQLSREKKRVSARDTRIPCFIQLANETGFPHEGLVDFVDNRMDPGTGTLRARGVFNNANGFLLPRMFARMIVPGSGRYTAVLIPDAAIDTAQSIKFVRVVQPDGAIEARPITPGGLFGAFRAIESGLTTHDRIVVNGLQRAIPGTRVRPQEIPMDLSGLRVLMPGDPAATQDLPATRRLSTTAATGPAATTRPTSTTVPIPAPAAPGSGGAPR